MIQADVNVAGTFRALAAARFDCVFHYAVTVGVRLTEEHALDVLQNARGLRHLRAF